MNNEIEERWEDIRVEMLKTNELVYQIYLQNEELIKRLEEHEND
jgi:hypothetical protein